MEPYWDQLKEIVRESDVVLEILDARAVELSRNEQLEQIIKDYARPRIFVINKADLVSKQNLAKAMDELKSKRQVPDEFIVYFSNRTRQPARNLLARIRQVFAKHGKRKEFENNPILKRPYREAKGDVIVGVVGYPNVGKSSVINALSFKKKAKVSSKAGTTHGIHWIAAGNSEIKLIDTPGVIPLRYNEETSLGLIAARNPEKMKDPEVVAGKILEMFAKAERLDKIERFYNFKISDAVKAEGKEANPYLILEEISIARKHLKKGGIADETRTAINVVKDWQTGRLKL